ncbi:hypothetical protein ACH4U6_25365 [Streptomyces netropsis]|uniref:hypothetical protein n=1 Tax=Streptomyces netropsis TaxID=55404 RepID=UPI0037908FA2
MGIESDQLVYDYLSQVGDLAQRRPLTSGERMRLVSRLRTEIERRRSAEGADSPAAVRRILDDLGTPDEAVAGAQAPGGGAGDKGRVPMPRREGEPVRFPAAAPPHLATEEELGRGTGGDRVDGWQQAGPGPFTAGDRVHGFVGGIEIPEMLKPPPTPAELARRDAAARPAGERSEQDTEGVGRGEDGGEGAGAGRPGLWRAGDGTPMSPLLLLVAALLLVGAVLGNWLVLAAGWALAYVTRRLSHTESQMAVMVVPGLTVAGGIAWLWGRANGRWGDPIPHGELGTALSATWPVVVRVAAVASALFVVWRARRSA